jgi:hypothetical protein
MAKTTLIGTQQGWLTVTEIVTVSTNIESLQDRRRSLLVHDKTRTPPTAAGLPEIGVGLAGAWRFQQLAAG